jgi:hypothetical protein
MLTAIVRPQMPRAVRDRASDGLREERSGMSDRVLLVDFENVQDVELEKLLKEKHRPLSRTSVAGV